MSDGNGARPGALMAIGGAEDKFEEKFILKNFFDLCGGKDAKIAIIPTASRLETTGSAYQAIFNDFGVQSVEVLPLFRRADANDPAVARVFEQATGIFMTGGDQSKILAVLGGTESLLAIQDANGRGAVIGGTSAGASALSDPMIAVGRPGSMARSGMVKLTTGLGLTKAFIVDQHFHQRERLGRLMYSVMLYPGMVGVGVDEDTAAILNPGGGCIDVIGRGTVTIVDGSELKMYNPASVPHLAPMVFSNMVLHSLTHGCRYSLEDRELEMDRRSAGPDDFC
jgi:cyanophycinase